MSENSVIVDGLQFVNWNRSELQKARDSGINAIHVTVTYWENHRETVANIEKWHRLFCDHHDLVIPVRRASDILEAKRLGKLGIIFGFQNCSPIEDDLGLVQVMYELGARIMQLSYNNQSLLATGCYEQRDTGITRFGREVIREMNRVGMVIDMSHSAEYSTLQAIELSERPIAITHANPSFFHDALRNKSDTVLRELGASGGMLGFSLYPLHLHKGSNCALEEFCEMVAKTADVMGIDNIGIGSDLCVGWDYDKLEWMRSGRWTFTPDYGEGSAEQKDWPAQPQWFRDSADIGNIATGLAEQGFSTADVNRVMGDNWLHFFERSFGYIDPAVEASPAAQVL